MWEKCAQHWSVSRTASALCDWALGPVLTLSQWDLDFPLALEPWRTHGVIRANGVVSSV